MVWTDPQIVVNKVGEVIKAEPTSGEGCETQ